MRKPITASLVAVVLVVTAGLASAAEFATRDEAKAMLDRAVVMLKTDQKPRILLESGLLT